MGLRVSLMPVERESGRRPDLRRRVIIAAVVLASELILLIAGNIVLASVMDRRTIDKDKLQGEIASVIGQIAEKEKAAKESAVLSRQMTLLEETLDRHIYWTEFFRFLEVNTLPTVRYTNIGGDAGSGIFSVDVVAAGYRDAVMQIVKFRDNPQVVQVKTSALSMQSDETGNVIGVNFSMSLKIKPVVWLKPDAAQIGGAPPADASAAR